MKFSKIFAALAVAGASVTATACLADAAGDPNTHHVGDTVEVPNYGGQSAQFRVFGINHEGNHMVMEATADCTKGTQYNVGTFEVLTKSGRKLSSDFETSYAQDPGDFYVGGSMVAGEHRDGKLVFDTPEDIQEVILDQGYPIVIWYN